jgi:hypothetical protein
MPFGEHSGRVENLRATRAQGNIADHPLGLMKDVGGEAMFIELIDNLRWQAPGRT